MRRIIRWETFFRPDLLNWIWKLDQGQVKADLLTEMQNSGCGNVIMSTESLASAPFINKIREYFADFEVFVVFFLRRQDHWLESALKEELKNGDVIDDKDNYLKTREHWLDYYQRLSLKWSGKFGQRAKTYPTLTK